MSNEAVNKLLCAENGKVCQVVKILVTGSSWANEKLPINSTTEKTKRIFFITVVFSAQLENLNRITSYNVCYTKLLRWKDFENGLPEIPAGFPSTPQETIPQELDPITSEFFEFYAMKRGHHLNAPAAFTLTSGMAFMNFPLLNYIETISPRPVLFIIGENAHSRYFSEDAFEQAAEPKELYIVPRNNFV